MLPKNLLSPLLRILFRTSRRTRNPYGRRRASPIGAFTVLLGSLVSAWYLYSIRLANVPRPSAPSSQVRISNAPASAGTPTPLPSDALPIQLINVHDGDSMKVRFLDGSGPRHSQGGDAPISLGEVRKLQNNQVSLRLCSIDAPEINQAHGTNSRDILASEVAGKRLFATIREQDQYGRQVATVFLEDGTNINRLMVQQGLAWHYITYSRDPALAKLEREAQLEKRGIWAEADPEAPWEYRKRTNPRR